MKDKLYSASDLLQLMGEEGLASSRMWLYYNERKGRLVCPRLPNSRRDRAFTEWQINEIIEAFRPGGKGYWRHK